MTTPSTPARAPRKDTLLTRQRIVDAAERLFAEHGIDNVTLLDIARAAHQKNRGALQYHFGDKAGLINAVLDKHGDLISLRRQALMKKIGTATKPTLRALVEAYVLPVAEHIDTTENTQAFLLINAQIMTSPEFTSLAMGRAERYPEVRQLMELMFQHVPAASKKRRDFKILLIRSMVFHGLAAHFSSKSGKLNRSLIETLCNSVLAVLESM